jgi:hypothetical protein
MPYQKIMDRDIEVVLSVYKHKYLTASQIQALHFPSKTTRDRRLRRLVEEGYLKPFEILNIPERIFQLTKRGAEAVAGALEVALDDLFWKPDGKSPSDHYFMRHFVALNDFRILLTRQLAGGGVRLRGFIPEYYGSKHASGRVTKYLKDVAFDIVNPKEHIPHTPDAVFCLEKGNKPALFFLEIDRGTEVLSSPEKGVLKMVRFYLAYLKGGGYKGYSEDFKAADPFASFRTLVVTTSRARIENMRQACAALPGEFHGGLRLLWCATFDEVAEGAIGRDIWTPLFAGDGQRYRIG